MRNMVAFTVAIKEASICAAIFDITPFGGVLSVFVAIGLNSFVVGVCYAFRRD